MKLDFFQLGYVTNDYARAKEQLNLMHGVQELLDLTDVDVPFEGGGAIRMNVGLGFKFGLQYELIEPLDDPRGIYTDLLPDDGFGFLLHQVGRHFEKREEMDRAVADAKTRWPLVLQGETLGGAYAYFDTYRERGYFLEFISLPGEAFAAVPEN